MYTMSLDNRLFYHPQLDDYTLERPTLTQEANKFASLTFTIYPNHPEYSNINKRRSVIAIYLDGALLVRFRPMTSKLTMRGGIEYKCAEEASILNDILRRPGWFSGTPEAFLASVISDFNARYEGISPVAPDTYLEINVPLYRTTPLMTGSSVRKCQTNLVMLGYSLPKYGIDGKYGDETANAVRRFRKDHGLSGDYVFDLDALNVMIALMNPETPSGDESTSTDTITKGTVAGISTETSTFINDDYIGYWDLLQERLVGVFGGYLIPRYTVNGITIDYLDEDNLQPSLQSIVFGENIADLFIETNASDTFSVLIPLGADVKAQNIQEGQAKQTPLTISSVNDGKDYLENADGLVLYGRREMTYRWEDVADASKLMTLGEAYLTEHAVRLVDNVTLNAVDLRDTGASIVALKWMERVSVSSELHGLVETYAITRKTTPLGEPKTAKIQLGAVRETLTDRIAGNAARAAQEYAFLTGRVFNIENPAEDS